MTRLKDDHPKRDEWDGLVLAARRDPEDGMERLLHCLRPRLYGWALSLSVDRDRAEDLTQEALVKVTGALGGFEGAGFSGWAYRIVLNLHRDRVRRAGRRAGLLEQAGTERVTPTAPGPDAAAAVQVFVRDLSEAQRVVFQLCDLEGWDTAAVAQSLGIAESTARVHLMRARKTIRTRIIEEGVG